MLNDVKWFGITTSFPYICIVNFFFNFIKSYVKSDKSKAIS